MAVNEHSPIKARGSLLERASETFDFRKAMIDAAPVAVPAPKPTSAPAAAPAPKPVAVVAPVVAPKPVPVAAPVAAPKPAEPEPIELTVAAPAPAAETPQAKPDVIETPEPEVRPRHDFTGRYGRVDRARLAEAGLIVPGAAASALSEEFRIVKRQLLLDAFGAASPARNRMILVASAQPNEGKTFCAMNLALSVAAESDLEVLLVDGDFAKPEIVAMLGLEQGPGLLDALADPALSAEQCIIRTDVAGLSVLPAGRHTHNDTELLAASRTRTVLKELLDANPNRIVIFDSPPVLAASPASVLALHAGQALFVVKADKTSEAELRDAIGLISGCETIQLLLNATTYAAGGRTFGSYYGYGDR